MRLAERILLALTSRDVLGDLGPVSQVKGDGAVDLLQSQRRKRRTDRFWGLAVLKLSHDARQGTRLSETGETFVLRAGRKQEVLARNELGERFIASPAISRGRLFLRSDRTLFAVGR
jgi:hypothetical protein